MVPMLKLDWSFAGDTAFTSFHDLDCTVKQEEDGYCADIHGRVTTFLRKSSMLEAQLWCESMVHQELLRRLETFK